MMRSPRLDQNPPAGLFSVDRGSFKHFDIATAPRMPTLLAGVAHAPRWSSPWALGGGFLGPSTTPHVAAATAVRLQDPWPAAPGRAGDVRLDIWHDIPRSLPSIGSSPRQRSGFLGDVTNTPAFFLAHSPSIASADAPVSPSLPFIAPAAQESSKRLASKTARKRQLFRTHLWTNSQAVWLGLYFTLNLCLTLYNKGVLVRFPYPYTLTAVHALFGSIGGQILKERGAYIPARLTTKGYTVLAAFSVLYSANIAISNLSLQLVTIPFHQVVRAATPMFITLLSITILGARFSNRKMVTLLVVMLGVALATYGDYYFTTVGFLLTLLGTFLAALKAIYTSILQSPSSTPHKARLSLIPPRLNLHPLDLVTRLSPLAFIQCITYAFLSGELGRIRSAVIDSPMSGSGWWYPLLLFGNGCIAFGLNVISFTANGKIGALNMTVAANVKQVLTILLSVVIFDLTITHANALGILVTIGGGAWYAWVEHEEKALRTWTNEKRVVALHTPLSQYSTKHYPRSSTRHSLDSDGLCQSGRL